MSTTPSQDLSQNKQSSLRGQTIATVILATCFVGLRFFARWKAGVRWGIDDWLTVVALGILFILLIIVLLSKHRCKLVTRT